MSDPSIFSRKEQKEMEKKRKFVFIDLGANSGDSIYHFLNINDDKTKKVYTFPDLLLMNVNDVPWNIYAIEANPVFDISLLNMRDDLNKKLPQHKVFLLNSTVAWIKDGQIDFYLDLINKDVNFWGSR